MFVEVPCWFRIFSVIIMFRPPFYDVSFCFADVIFPKFTNHIVNFYTVGITFYPSKETECVFALFPN